MPTNYPINPDTPLPISMLPEADELDGNDLLLVTQPGAELGRRSKNLRVSTLLGGPLARFANPVIKSNILSFVGSLAETKQGNQYTEVCHLDIDPRLDVEFHVFGTSGQADTGNSGRWDYGLRAKVRQFYVPDDQDRELIAAENASFVAAPISGPATGVGIPTYNSVFGCLPHTYVVTPAVLANYPTKRVTLFLSGGSSANPTQLSGPSSYDLKIQATIYPSAYDSEILKATEAT